MQTTILKLGFFLVTFECKYYFFKYFNAKNIVEDIFDEPNYCLIIMILRS